MWSPCGEGDGGIADLEVDGAARGRGSGVTVEADAHRRAVDGEQVGRGRCRADGDGSAARCTPGNADLGERDRHHDRLQLVDSRVVVAGRTPVTVTRTVSPVSGANATGTLCDRVLARI